MSRISFQFPSHLDRSVGWILATSWRIAEPTIAAMVAPPKETK